MTTRKITFDGAAHLALIHCSGGCQGAASRGIGQSFVVDVILNLSRALRSQYAYYGIAGNRRALQRVHRFLEHTWRQMLTSCNRAAYITWRH